jgi:hypothetical protein
MSNADPAKTQMPPPGLNGWGWAMGGALIAGLVVGTAMWLVGKRNNAIYEAQLAERERAYRQLQQKLDETALILAAQAARLNTLEKKSETKKHSGEVDSESKAEP